MAELAAEINSKNIVEFEDVPAAESLIEKDKELQNVLIKAYGATDATHSVVKDALVIDNVGYFTKCRSMLPTQIISMCVLIMIIIIII